MNATGKSTFKSPKPLFILRETVREHRTIVSVSTGTKGSDARLRSSGGMSALEWCRRAWRTDAKGLGDSEMGRLVLAGIAVLESPIPVRESFPCAIV
jgi:hypothetical protein